MVVARSKVVAFTIDKLLICTKMSVAARDTPLSHIHKYLPISLESLRHSSSSHSKQRPSLPKHSHSASKLKHKKRKCHNQP